MSNSHHQNLLRLSWENTLRIGDVVEARGGGYSAHARITRINAKSFRTELLEAPQDVDPVLTGYVPGRAITVRRAFTRGWSNAECAAPVGTPWWE